MDQTPEKKYVSDLIVKVRTGYGIYPLEGALVTVTAENFQNGEVLAESFTDASGRSEKISVILPPSSAEIVPAQYTVTVAADKEGYRRAVFQGIELYDGVTTLLPVNMVALPDLEGALLREYDSEMIVSTPSGKDQRKEETP